MKVVAIAGQGPAGLSIAERAAPPIGPEELRVRVHAAALNRADLLQSLGQYPAPAGFPPDVPGLEYAGEVIEVGARVQRFRPGERVMGIIGGGAFSEEVAVHEREALSIPDRLSFEEAAALPEAFLTAFDAIVVQGGLRPEERVLIHAVASGVGSAGAQIARAFGAHVIGTARTASKLERACEWGVTQTLPISDPPQFSAKVKELTGGHGIDVALELVAGPYLPETVRSMAPHGRLIVVGTLGGAKAEVPLGELMRRRVTLKGTVLRSRPLEEKIALARRFEAECLPLIARGVINPVIERVMPMAQIREAAEQMASNATVGKLVLRW